jgi:hypothetical protein
MTESSQQTNQHNTTTNMHNGFWYTKKITDGYLLQLLIYILKVSSVVARSDPDPK